jgi:hypothetical protein
MNMREYMPSNPSFIVIGAAKSGTTSLADYLGQHPEVCFSAMKEARYLAYRNGMPEYRGYGKMGSSIMNSYGHSLPRSWKEYQQLFASAQPGQKTGEASPAYLYLPGVAEQIHEVLPEVKLIAILRNPVDRAYSSFLHMRRENAEIDSFQEALSLEEHRINEGAGLPYHYKSMGFYGKQLAEYYRIFGHSRIKVVFYEELCKDPSELMTEICRFLEINPDFEFSFGRVRNVSGVPSNRKLYELLRNPGKSPLLTTLGAFLPKSITRKLRSGINRRLLKKPSITTQSRDQLRVAYQDDLTLLEKVTGLQHPWH